MKIRIIIILIILAVCYLATSVNAQPIDYQGIGILKVKQGDTIHILPHQAYVINPDIFQLGVDAVDFVRSNNQDSLVKVQELEIERQDIIIKNKDALIDSCIEQREQFIEESNNTIRNLRLNNSKQKDTIEDLDDITAAQRKELKQTKRKLKAWKFTSSGVIAVLLTKIGIDYFL